MLLIPVIYRELYSAEDKYMVLKAPLLVKASTLLQNGLLTLLERINSLNSMLPLEEEVGLFGLKRRARPFFQGLNLDKLPPSHEIFELELFLYRNNTLNPKLFADFTVVPFKNFSVCTVVILRERDSREASDLAREIGKRYKSSSAVAFVEREVFGGYIFVDTDETNLFYRACPHKGTHYRDFRYETKKAVARVIENIFNENEKHLKDYVSRIRIPKWIQTIPFEKTAYRVEEFEIKIGFTPTATEKDLFVEPVFITSTGTIRVKDFLKIMDLSESPKFTIIDALLIWAIDKTKNPIQFFFEKNIPENKIPLIPTYIMRYMLSPEYALKY